MIQSVSRYRKQHQEVRQVTFNPQGPGVVRIHLIPPRNTKNGKVESVVILNGQYVIPLGHSWSILLECFMDQLESHAGHTITIEDLAVIHSAALKDAKKVFTFVPVKKLKTDLHLIINTLCDIAYEHVPNVKVGGMSIREYSKYMSAPHRMDLLVSPMTINGCWHCNQKCLHCYAANQEYANHDSLSTEEWKMIIDECKAIGIPQLTFTGGEPTLREDLPELIKYSKWFVSRLNTNGLKLTKDYCQRLFDAELDSIQITLYSRNPKIHNELVGLEGGFEKTTYGIKNAIEAGLDVSVNTPLCSINKDYIKLLEYLHKLGVHYVSCSGLILTGNATTDKSKRTQLSSEELEKIISDATSFCAMNDMEISFTSPGWLDADVFKKYNLNIPSCGACLSNMAIAPDGEVIPCQSWLSEGLGNILFETWESIWNKPLAKKLQQMSDNEATNCPFRTMNKG